MVDHYTCPIVVNGVSHVWMKETISRDEVLELGEMPHGVIGYLLHHHSLLEGSVKSNHVSVGMLTRGESLNLKASLTHSVVFAVTINETIYCEECGCLIDPDTCYCGGSMHDHTGWEHSPVLMGCVCGYVEYEAREIVEPSESYYNRVMCEDGVMVQRTSEAAALSMDSSTSDGLESFENEGGLTAATVISHPF